MPNVTQASDFVRKRASLGCTHALDIKLVAQNLAGAPRGPDGCAKAEKSRGPRRTSTPAFFSLDQVLRDLHGVGGGTLADLVAAAPERERAHALGRGEVAPQAADPD